MLTESTLQKLVRAPESRTLEKKRNCPNGSELRKSLVALANSTYGDEYSVLLLGVSDDGKAVGLDGLDSMQKTLLATAKECYPPVPLLIQTFEYDGKDLLAAVIRDASDKPYFSGKSYKRNGSISEEASKIQFEELIAQRNDKASRILMEKGKDISIEFPNGDRIARFGTLTTKGYTPGPN